MLHWLNAPKHKVRKFTDDNGQVSFISDIDPLLVPIIEIAKRNGMQDVDIELITEELNRKQISFPVSEQEKFVFIYHIIKVLSEELNFDSSEQKLFREIANAIELPAEKIESLIASVYSGIVTKISIEEAKKAFFGVLST
ncbi:MAG: hypothetical protein ACKVOU_12945 [Cytophagales bacterium]